VTLFTLVSSAQVVVCVATAACDLGGDVQTQCKVRKNRPKI
jgi:hypothetical protein